ncbi:MAG: O-antigen ligase family protein [Actinomycetota bacterium]
MTTTAASLRSELYDGQGDALLPVATFGAQVFIFGALVYSFLVTGFELLPTITPLALVFGAVGVLFLTPRMVLHRIPISLMALVLLGWMAASQLWSDNAVATAGGLEALMPLLIGTIICTGVISMRDLVPALLWTFRFSVGLTIFALITMPETRIHIDIATETTHSGWHGLFPHKNIMTPYLVAGIVTILTFDRTRILKWGTLAGIVGILLGSSSVTGMSSAFLAVSVWVWLQLYRNLDIRNSSIFLFSSISVGVFALLGVVASLATLTSASGRDLTFTGRTLIWAATLRAWEERPLFGWGFGGILTTDPVSPRTAEIWREIGFRVPHAHSGPIDLGLQLGVIGLVIFVVLYVTTMIDGIRAIKDRPEIGAWIVSIMIVQLYMSFSENVFIGYGWLVFLLMFRTVLMRKHGMEVDTSNALVESVRDRMDDRGRLVRR